MVCCRLLLACLGVLCVVTTVRAEVAWQGGLGAQAMTEFRVTLDATQPPQPLVLEQRGWRVELPASTVAGRRDLYLPLLPETRDAATLRVGEEVSSAPRLRAIAAGDWIAAPTADALNAIVEGPTPVAASTLPRIASAYRHIRSLAIDGGSLARLDDRQLRALLAFAASCGTLVLVDVPPDAARLFGEQAACAQRHVHRLTTVSTNQLVDAYRAALAQAPGPLPEHQRLERLLPPADLPLRLAVLLLCGFVLVLLALQAARVRPVLPFAFCVLASVLAAALFSARDPAQFVLTWAESTGDEQRARYAGIERQVGAARGSVRVSAATLATDVVNVIGDELVLRWDAQPEARAFSWRSALFRDLKLHRAGAVTIPLTLRAQAGDDYVTVCNTGPTGTAAAYLRWDRTTWAVPPLAAGEHWTTASAVPVTEADAPLRLFAERVSSPEPALLQVHTRAKGSRRQQDFVLRREQAGGGAACHAT